jgi:hypothetical protein
VREKARMGRETRFWGVRGCLDSKFGHEPGTSALETGTGTGYTNCW